MSTHEGGWAKNPNFGKISRSYFPLAPRLSRLCLALFRLLVLTLVDRLSNGLLLATGKVFALHVLVLLSGQGVIEVNDMCTRATLRRKSRLWCSVGKRRVRQPFLLDMTVYS